jgi:hypothetical protein
VALASGCARVGDLRFRQDDRLTFSAPQDGATVQLPLTISWTMTDFATQKRGSAVRPDSGYFAVVVDQYPMGPGKPLTDLLPDGTCTGDPTCPSPDMLETLANTYVTSTTSVTLPSVPASRYGTSTHFAVVVLVDGSGRRIGDSSWTVNFTVEDPGGSS